MADPISSLPGAGLTTFAAVGDAGKLKVERVQEREAVLAALARDGVAAICGAARLGKTTLARDVAARYRARGATVVTVACDHLSLESEDRWARGLVAQATSQGGLEPFFLEVGWTPREVLARWLDHALPESEERAPLLVVDELNWLAGWATRTKSERGVAHSCAEWLSQELVDRVQHGRFALLLVGTVPPREVAPDSALAAIQPVWLRDFTRAETDVFAAALGTHEQAWLDEIFRWVGGHPLLTQMWCASLLNGELGPVSIEGGSPRAPPVDPARAAAFARALTQSISDAIALRIVEEELDRLGARAVEVLDLYQRCRDGALVLPRAGSDTSTAPEGVVDAAVSVGLVRVTPGDRVLRAEVRCRLFQDAFDAGWLDGRIDDVGRPYARLALGYRRGTEPLPEGAPAQEALAWLLHEQRYGGLTPAEEELLAALALADRARYGRRLALIALTIVSVIAVVSTVIVSMYDRAEARAREAEERARAAEADARAAEADARAAEDRARAGEAEALAAAALAARTAAEARAALAEGDVERLREILDGRAPPSDSDPLPTDREVRAGVDEAQRQLGVLAARNELPRDVRTVLDQVRRHHRALGMLETRTRSAARVARDDADYYSRELNRLRATLATTETQLRRQLQDAQLREQLLRNGLATANAAAASADQARQTAEAALATEQAEVQRLRQQLSQLQQTQQQLQQAQQQLQQGRQTEQQLRQQIQQLQQTP